jgi:hypothetical protein
MATRWIKSKILVWSTAKVLLCWILIQVLGIEFGSWVCYASCLYLYNVEIIYKKYSKCKLITLI